MSYLARTGGASSCLSILPSAYGDVGFVVDPQSVHTNIAAGDVCVNARASIIHVDLKMILALLSPAKGVD